MVLTGPDTGENSEYHGCKCGWHEGDASEAISGLGPLQFCIESHILFSLRPPKLKGSNYNQGKMS